MIIMRMSVISGITREKDLDITLEQIQRVESGELLQDVMSNLSEEEREFYLTGSTAAEWDAAFFEPEQ